MSAPAAATAAATVGATAAPVAAPAAAAVGAPATAVAAPEFVAGVALQPLTTMLATPTRTTTRPSRVKPSKSCIAKVPPPLDYDALPTYSATTSSSSSRSCPL